MITKEDIAAFRNWLEEELDEYYFDCIPNRLEWIYDKLFSKVNYTKSRLVPKLDDFTSLFGEYFSESDYTIEGNTATVTTPYDVFIFEDRGKGNIRMESPRRPALCMWVTYYEPRDIVGFIADSVAFASAVEPVWKEYEPRFQEKKRIHDMEDRYSQEFRTLKKEYVSALCEDKPVEELEDRIRKTEEKMREELGTADGGPSKLDAIRKEAKEEVNRMRKSEERSRRASESYRRRKEEREARYKRCADDIEAMLGVRPWITRTAPLSGGKHYDAVVYRLPNGQRVKFKYYGNDSDKIMADAEALRVQLPLLRSLSELSSTKLKVGYLEFGPSTESLLQSWKKQALDAVGDRPALREMMEGIESVRASFHVNQRNVELRLFTKIGSWGYLSASLPKGASADAVAAFSQTVKELMAAEDSLKEGRHLSYSIE